MLELIKKSERKEKEREKMSWPQQLQALTGGKKGKKDAVVWDLTPNPLTPAMEEVIRMRSKRISVDYDIPITPEPSEPSDEESEASEVEEEEETEVKPKVKPEVKPKGRAAKANKAPPKKKATSAKPSPKRTSTRSTPRRRSPARWRRTPRSSTSPAISPLDVTKRIQAPSTRT